MTFFALVNFSLLRSQEVSFHLQPAQGMDSAISDPGSSVDGHQSQSLATDLESLAPLPVPDVSGQTYSVVTIPPEKALVTGDGTITTSLRNLDELVAKMFERHKSQLGTGPSTSAQTTLADPSSSGLVQGQNPPQ